jgi:hypothetical protein
MIAGLHTRLFGFRAVWLGAVMCLLAAEVAAAQVSIEVRGGAAVGNYLPAAAGIDRLPGPSVSAYADYAVRSWLALYGSYTYGIFRCQNGFCHGDRVTVASSGFGAGARFAGFGPAWARAGFLYHGSSVRTATGTYAVDAAPGYEVGWGVSYPINTRFDLVTGVDYRSHFDPTDRTSVLTAEAGVRYRLGDPLAR